MANEDEELKQLGLLKSSQIVSDFVEKQQGKWNHSDWEGLVKKVREQNITISDDKIGVLLEEERINYFNKKAEISEKKEPEKIVLNDANNFDKLGKKREEEIHEIMDRRNDGR